MAGILDNKTRMLDTIITREGRRQMAAGNLRVHFVSYTDSDTFYEKDAISGSTDPSERIFLEASHLPQDQITFEADDSGRLIPFRGGNLDVINGNILSGSSDAFLKIVTGSAFASTSELLLDSSIDNFQKLFIIKTEDVFFDRSDEFELAVNDIDFVITDSSPIPLGVSKVAKIDKIESLLQDRRLSHLPNFRYLPPINKPDITDSEGSLLGDFPVLGERTAELTYQEIEKELERKPFKTVEFAQTSQVSNIVSQFFEQKDETLRKLDVIDFGEFVTNDPDFPTKHIFFVGRIFIDGFGAQTFVNMFSLVFE